MTNFESAISPRDVGEKNFFCQFPTHIRVGFKISPPFCPVQFVRVLLPLQPHVQDVHLYVNIYWIPSASLWNSTTVTILFYMQYILSLFLMAFLMPCIELHTLVQLLTLYMETSVWNSWQIEKIFKQICLQKTLFC